MSSQSFVIFTQFDELNGLRTAISHFLFFYFWWHSTRFFCSVDSNKNSWPIFMQNRDNKNEIFDSHSTQNINYYVHFVLFDRNVTCIKNSSYIPFNFVCTWGIFKCCYSNYGCNSKVLCSLKPSEHFRNCQHGCVSRAPWNNYIRTRKPNS